MDDKGLKRVHLWIAGQVQGVSYRYSTEKQARLHQVQGWVRNLMDGRVEAVIEGEPDRVDAMVAWCHRGPGAAIVESVELVEEPPERLRNFTIRR
jgi:acylphosphatase